MEAIRGTYIEIGLFGIGRHVTFVLYLIRPHAITLLYLTRYEQVPDAGAQALLLALFPTSDL